jgi:guanylate kinase
MTSKDFEQVCAREGITVKREKIDKAYGKNAKGVYTRALDTNEPVITIDPSLRGYQRVRVEFHELARHFLHGNNLKNLRRFSMKTGKFPQLTPAKAWQEVEADAAALCAIAPGFPTVHLIRTVTDDLETRKTVWTEGGAQ